MSILVFGSTGQLGSSLRDTRPRNGRPAFIDRSLCDLQDPEAVSGLLAARRPKTVINAAAYTAVDGAEADSELAFRINAEAVARMAAYVSVHDARLIHLSTDFVFDGAKTTPYRPGDPTRPLGAYGDSKLAGERAALARAPAATMIVRTSRVYGEHGDNFVKTILRLLRERDDLQVVDDQRGSPTYSRSLAEVIWRLCAPAVFAPGVYHWTDQGAITWFEFALAIREEALRLGILRQAARVRPVATGDYPTPARRPGYSVLDNGRLSGLLGMAPPPWRDNLKLMLGRLA